MIHIFITTKKLTKASAITLLVGSRYRSDVYLVKIIERNKWELQQFVLVELA